MPPRLPASPFSSLRWSVTIQRYILAEILVSSIAIYIYIYLYTEKIRWILETSRVNIRASTYYLCDHVSTVSPALTHSALDVRICIIRVTCFMGYYDRLRLSLCIWKYYNLPGEGNFPRNIMFRRGWDIFGMLSLHLEKLKVGNLSYYHGIIICRLLSY